MQITDKFTFVEPADLDFDSRYVIKCGPNGENLVSQLAEDGVILMYMVIYAKGDALVGEYDFNVCDSAESATAYKAYYVEVGMDEENIFIPEVDATVMYNVTDKDLLSSIVLQYQGMGMLPDNVTPADFAQFMANIYGDILQK